MKIKTISNAVTVLLLSLFMFTGLTKLLKYQQFINEIKQSPYLKPIADYLAWSLPACEILIAILLVTKRWRLRALYGYTIMMLLFNAHLLLLSNESSYIPCGCGGFFELLPLPYHIALNISITLLALVAISIERRISYQVKVDGERLKQ